jgi:hypothetical protein
LEVAVIDFTWILGTIVTEEYVSTPISDLPLILALLVPAFGARKF